MKDLSDFQKTSFDIFLEIIIKRYKNGEITFDDAMSEANAACTSDECVIVRDALFGIDENKSNTKQGCAK